MGHINHPESWYLLQPGQEGGVRSNANVVRLRLPNRRPGQGLSHASRHVGSSIIVRHISMVFNFQTLQHEDWGLKIEQMSDLSTTSMCPNSCNSFVWTSALQALSVTHFVLEPHHFTHHMAIGDAAIGLAPSGWIRPSLLKWCTPSASTRCVFFDERPLS